MASEHNAVSDLERLEHRVLPDDPPASADLLVEEDRLPYDLAGPKLSTALVRLVEHFGLPERPVVAAREEDGEDGDTRSSAAPRGFGPPARRAWTASPSAHGS